VFCMHNAQLVGGRNLRHFDVDAALVAEAEEPDGSSSTGFEEEVSSDTLTTAVLLNHPRVRARPLGMVCGGCWVVSTFLLTCRSGVFACRLDSNCLLLLRMINTWQTITNLPSVGAELAARGGGCVRQQRRLDGADGEHDQPGLAVHGELHHPGAADAQRAGASRSSAFATCAFTQANSMCAN